MCPLGVVEYRQVQECGVEESRPECLFTYEIYILLYYIYSSLPQGLVDPYVLFQGILFYCFRMSFTPAQLTRVVVSVDDSRVHHFPHGAVGVGFQHVYHLGAWSLLGSGARSLHGFYLHYFIAFLYFQHFSSHYFIDLNLSI